MVSTRAEHEASLDPLEAADFYSRHPRGEKAFDE